MFGETQNNISIHHSSNELEKKLKIKICRNLWQIKQNNNLFE